MADTAGLGLAFLDVVMMEGQTGGKEGDILGLEIVSLLEDNIKTG